MNIPDPLLSVDWGTVLVATITAVVGIIVGVLTARGKRREDTQILIDQIQEERNLYADLLREERAAGEKRMDRMWAEKAASRRHVAELRAHIYHGDDPPPPDPPPGYLE